VSLTPPDDPESSRTISVPVDLDDDGFLRRECPHCEREFKWRPADDSEPMQAGGYHCPYCNRQADQNAWFTKPQLEYVEAIAANEVVGPLLDEFGRSVDRINRSSSGMISARFERDDIPPAVKPHEPNDMRRVDFKCHSKEPLKVLDDWTGQVHCLICGSVAQV
jgi:hypothetical protein